MYDPWGILFYLTLATGMGIVVSLMTRPVEKNRLDQFYDLTRTPIQPGETLEHPCTLPSGVEPGTRPMLITRFGLEVPQPSRTSLVGFLAGATGVVVLIGGFVWIVR